MRYLITDKIELDKLIQFQQMLPEFGISDMNIMSIEDDIICIEMTNKEKLVDLKLFDMKQLRIVRKDDYGHDHDIYGIFNNQRVLLRIKSKNPIMKLDFRGDVC
jgi:hypothetical protein